MGQHNDQRALTEEGGLAAHVRACDQPESIVRAKAQVIGDEPIAVIGQRMFDNRVAAAIDFQARVIDDRRQRPLALRRARGIAGGDVDSCNRIGGGRDGGRRICCQLGQLFQVSGLGGQRMAAGFNELGRFLMQGR